MTEASSFKHGLIGYAFLIYTKELAKMHTKLGVDNLVTGLGESNPCDTINKTAVDTGFVNPQPLFLRQWTVGAENFVQASKIGISFGCSMTSGLQFKVMIA